MTVPYVGDPKRDARDTLRLFRRNDNEHHGKHRLEDNPNGLRPIRSGERRVGHFLGNPNRVTRSNNTVEERGNDGMWRS
jgi:hypothetical protein